MENNYHPLSLVPHIISNSNGNVKQADDLREKEVCAKGNLCHFEKGCLSLSKPILIMALS